MYKEKTITLADSNGEEINFSENNFELINPDIVNENRNKNDIAKAQELVYKRLFQKRNPKDFNFRYCKNQKSFYNRNS